MAEAQKTRAWDEKRIEDAIKKLGAGNEQDKKNSKELRTIYDKLKEVSGNKVNDSMREYIVKQVVDGGKSAAQVEKDLRTPSNAGWKKLFEADDAARKEAAKPAEKRPEKKEEAPKAKPAQKKATVASKTGWKDEVEKDENLKEFYEKVKEIKESFPSINVDIIMEDSVKFVKKGQADWGTKRAFKSEEARDAVLAAWETVYGEGSITAAPGEKKGTFGYVRQAVEKKPSKEAEPEKKAAEAAKEEAKQAEAEKAAEKKEEKAAEKPKEETMSLSDLRSMGPEALGAYNRIDGMLQEAQRKAATTRKESVKVDLTMPYIPGSGLYNLVAGNYSGLSWYEQVIRSIPIIDVIANLLFPPTITREVKVPAKIDPAAMNQRLQNFLAQNELYATNEGVRYRVTGAEVDSSGRVNVKLSPEGEAAEEKKRPEPPPREPPKEAPKEAPKGGVIED